MIECIREIKDSENYSSNDALVIKCFVESLLKEKLSITKLLKIEASMFYCINVIYGLIELDCKDTMSIYLPTNLTLEDAAVVVERLLEITK